MSLAAKRERGNLILTRRKGEAVRIGDDIDIEIAEIRGNRVKVKVTAPVSAIVLRGETVAKLAAAGERPTPKPAIVNQPHAA